MPSERNEPRGAVVTSQSRRFAFLLTTVAGYLDAYAFMTHGAFAAAQTGNLVLLATAPARGRVAETAGSAWSLLAFVIGTGVAIHVNRRRHEWTRVRFPLRWLIAAQALVLLLLGFLPGSAPSWLVIVPLVGIAGMLFELFRVVDGQKFVPVTMTGNLVRLLESTYVALVERDRTARAALPVQALVITVYLAGAVVATVVTRLAGTHAVWVATVAMALLLTFFYLDDRRQPRPEADIGSRGPAPREASRKVYPRGRR